MDSIKVWDETGIVVDGHRRLAAIEANPRIVEVHGLPEVKRLSFRTAGQAKAWAIGNQESRRNVSKVAQAVLDGPTVEPMKPGPKAGDCDNDVTNSDAERQERHRNKQAAEGYLAVADWSPEAAAAIVGDLDTAVTKRDLHRVAKALEHLRDVGESGDDKEVWWAREMYDSAVSSVAAKALRKPHVANNSGENEWYTPPEYIAAARKVMRTIDIDPASSDKAQEIVKADRYYTKENCGLEKSWACANLWPNPPYAQPPIGRFTAKLCEAFGTQRRAAFPRLPRWWYNREEPQSVWEIHSMQRITVGEPLTHQLEKLVAPIELVDEIRALPRSLRASPNTSDFRQLSLHRG